MGSREVTRAKQLACAAANSASLAACYREQAERRLRQARDLDLDGDWAVDVDGIHPPRGLPDDWMEIGENFEKSVSS